MSMSFATTIITNELDLYVFRYELYQIKGCELDYLPSKVLACKFVVAHCVEYR